MSIFDLLFVALVVAAVVTLLAAGVYALRGKFELAQRILLRLAVCTAVYFWVVIATSLALPRKTFAVGENQCFDDWCIRVDGYKTVPGNGKIAYTVNLHVLSRAKRVSQREKSLAVYLTDEEGKRYDPVAEKSTGRFDVLLGQGVSAAASQRFVLRAGARHDSLVAAHEGGFPIAWFIIGYDTWFRKPAIVPLD